METLEKSLLITGLFCLVGVISLLRWVLLSPQQEVPRTIANLLWLTIRVVFFYAIVWLITCPGLGFRAVESSIATTALVLVLPLIRFNARDERHWTAVDRIADAFPFSEPVVISFFAVVLMVLFLPLVLLREFLIGETSDRLIPQRNDKSESASDQLNSLPLGKVAVNVAPLKPSGVIELDGERYNACSYTGRFIANGTRVQICGDRQGVPLVREISHD